MIELHLGDCLNVLRAMPEMSVDAIVTDPPYGLSFMGKRWDYDVPSVEIWRECLRVLKPGGHLLSFAGTRTQHRMAVNIEDAGFEIRDMIAWVYGSGFPKSLDVSKAIDKAAGADREVVGTYKGTSNIGRGSTNSYITTESGHATDVPITAPATEAARQWNGWGTALKPAMEPITVARKPLIGTVAENVLRHGTGAINVDGCRVPHGDDVDLSAVQRQQAEGTGIAVGKGYVGSILGKEIPMYKPAGRWPANLIHDGSDEVVGLFPETGPSPVGGKNYGRHDLRPQPGANGTMGSGWHGDKVVHGFGDSGSAARFFYCAKASNADRDEGCEGLATKTAMQLTGRKEGSRGLSGSEEHGNSTNPFSNSGSVMPRRNHHPTVKPTALMRYLCRLVTPPGGIVLDPFMGSGSTGKAAVLEGFSFIGIEREPEYMEIARRRIHAVQPMPEPVNDSVTYVQPSLF